MREPGGMAIGERVRWVLGVDDGQRLHRPRGLAVRRFGEPGFPGIALVALVLVVGAACAGVIVAGSRARGGDAVILAAAVMVPALLALGIASLLSPRHDVRPPVAGQGDGDRRAPKAGAEGIFGRMDRSNQEFLDEASTVSHQDVQQWGGYRRARARLVIALGGLTMALAIATVVAFMR